MSCSCWCSPRRARSPPTSCASAWARSRTPCQSISCSASISANCCCRPQILASSRSASRRCSISRQPKPCGARFSCPYVKLRLSHGRRSRPSPRVARRRGAMSEQRDITSNIDLLLATLPPQIQQAIEAGPDTKEDLIEIIMDLGRLPEARYRAHERFLSNREITQEDIDYATHRIGTFGEDNRAGIPRTLHRISVIRNRASKAI